MTAWAAIPGCAPLCRRNVVVTLDAPVTTGALWPMLHLDAGTIGTYEFPGVDGPVKSGSDIVMKKITVTVG
jgi:hypothetical protein